MTPTHETFMRLALDLAGRSLARDEFPVGCVLVHDAVVIASGNRTGTKHATPSEITHAEMTALRDLEKKGLSIDRKHITLYCTLEPCLMCFGAIMISGIGSIVYAYEDAMGGGTSCDRSSLPPLYRKNTITIVPGVLREQSLSLLQSYYAKPSVGYWRNSLLEQSILA